MIHKKNFLSLKSSFDFKIYILYSFLIHLIILCTLGGFWKKESKKVYKGNYIVVNLVKESINKNSENEKQNTYKLEGPLAKIESQNDCFKEEPEKPIEPQIAAKIESHIDNFKELIKSFSPPPSAVNKFSLPLPAVQPFSAVGLKFFYQSINGKLLHLIQNSIAEEFADEFGPWEAIFKISFNDGGQIESITPLSEKDDAFLSSVQEKIFQSGISSPRKFGLPQKEVKLEIKVDEQGKAHINAKLM